MDSPSKYEAKHEAISTMPSSRKNNIQNIMIPDRVVSHIELKRNTGERGTRKFIAVNGIVYDVTDCPKWRLEMHEWLHFPGQDLTSELPDAPHKEEVFKHDCVKIIGRLEV